MTGEVRVLPLLGIPEIEEGDDLAALLVEAAARAGGLADNDVLVGAQKVVSKEEGRVVHLEDVEPSPEARELAEGEDPRRVEMILRESRRVVRSRPPLVIAETRHGFVCASAGVDSSNAKGPGTVVLLPLDPDASAIRLRRASQVPLVCGFTNSVVTSGISRLKRSSRRCTQSSISGAVRWSSNSTLSPATIWVGPK